MSKKVKGQKLDLATFVGPNTQMNLPTAPDPNRIVQERGFPRGERGERPERGERRDRDDRQSSRFGDSGGQSEENWGRRAAVPSGGGGSSFGGGGSSFQNNRERKFESSGPVEERPSHMRLKLTPKGGSDQPTQTASPATASADGEDKWSKVFGKNDNPEKPRYQARQGGFSSDARSGDARSGGSDRYAPPGQRGQDVHSMALPSGPRGSVSAAPVPVALPPAPKVDHEAIEKAKKEKAAARLEAERVAKETKEAAKVAAEAAAEKRKTDRANAYDAAVALLATGAKGAALATAGKTVATTGSAVLKAVFATEKDLIAAPWHTKAEYGEILHSLLLNKVEEQVNALNVVQEYCHAQGFPKVLVKNVHRRLIEVLFGVLLSHELVDLEGFLSWADDLSTEDIPGRLDAVVQTTNFMTSVRNAMEETYDDDAEEDEIDAPRATVK